MIGMESPLGASFFCSRARFSFAMLLSSYCLYRMKAASLIISLMVYPLSVYFSSVVVTVILSAYRFKSFSLYFDVCAGALGMLTVTASKVIMISVVVFIIFRDWIFWSYRL